MLKQLTVQGLNSKISGIFKFHEDINIITGKNGSGKTTLLKLLWYAISGNLERIVPEIEFDFFELITTNAYVCMTNSLKSGHIMITLSYSVKNAQKKEITRAYEKSSQWNELQEVNGALAIANQTSFFFPTFRRIEGGFSISSRAQLRQRSLFGEVEQAGNAVQEVMNGLAERISVYGHRFIASISSDDINRMLTDKYAEISKHNDKLRVELSDYILRLIGNKNDYSTNNL